MGMNLFEKIASAHLVSGELRPGSEIALKIDQTLTQDALGAMAYLQFEAIGIPHVQTELSVSYVDHLMMQLGEGNADVHRYLETVADRYGILFSRPGNGICHQVHLERFGRPGKTLIGCDSHTVTNGAMGMIALGAGGLDVAMAMAGKPFPVTCPRTVHVVLTGRLSPWSESKDIVLEVLRRLTCKGNVGTVIEYGGPGVSTLTVPQRATMANMGAETGVTTSLFPSDEQTRRFLAMQGREDAYLPLAPDADAEYDRELVIALDQIEPSVALPHSPDQVKPVRALAGLPVSQVLIGSCTNSSYHDLMLAAAVLRGNTVHPSVSLGIVPGSRQVLTAIAENGALADCTAAGARILESGCGFCIGHGQTPQLGSVSVRTNNRNYKGRCGTQEAGVYLVSPAVAAATALTGVLTDPRTLGIPYPDIPMPERMRVSDAMILRPTGTKEIFRNRMIGSAPVNTPMPDRLAGRVVIRLGDNINTDDISPAGPAMTHRANIQKTCEYLFCFMDEHFPENCKRNTEDGFASVIVAGESYGQGSSREHAAMCPMVLGVRAVLAKSIERIHQANLINFGILPLLFANEADYDEIQQGDVLVLENTQDAVLKDVLTVQNTTRGTAYTVKNGANERQRKIVLAGGLLNSI